MPDDVILVEISNRIATITLNRPAARNALSNELLRRLPAELRAADANDDVDVVILTGADPAFCAGLDLKELGNSGANLGAAGLGDSETVQTRGPFPAMSKPVIGAINGAAITGGLEVALNCDFLIASERARFADTHARVGVMPGWGLTVLLPQAIGVRRAREMSYTGNFLNADEAFHWGLVNRVVAHDELLPAARAVAAHIVGNDQAGVRDIRGTYAEITRDEPGWQIEARRSRAWQRTMFSANAVAQRRDQIIERGRGQVS